MPDTNGELNKVELKTAQEEFGGDFNNENPVTTDSDLEQKPEKPLNILESQLTQEEKVWHNMAGNIFAVGQVGSSVYKDLNRYRDSNANNVVIDELASPEALLRQIEKMQYRIADLSEASKLYIQQAMQLREKLKELSTNQALSPDSLSAVLLGLTVAMQNAGNNLLQARQTVEQISLFENAYINRLLKSEGYNLLEDLKSHVQNLFERRQQLAGKRFGGLRHRKEITQLDEEYNKGRELLNKAYVHYSSYQIEIKQAMSDFHEQAYQTVKTAAEACVVRFETYLKSRPIGKPSKSMTKVIPVLNNVSEMAKDGYMEILRLMPNSEVAKQRFAVERSFQKIWSILNPALEAARQSRYDDKLPRRNNFYLPESSVIRIAARNAEINEWKTITADERVRECASPEQIQIWERRMGEMAAMELASSYERSDYENDNKHNCLDKMLAWGGAEIAVQTLVETRVRFGQFFGHDYNEKLAQFARRISESELTWLKAQSPSAARAFELIKKHPKDLGKEKTSNPEYEELMAQIKNDPEVTRTVRQQCREYVKADQIYMLCVEASGAVSGMYKDYGSNWMHILTVPELEKQSKEAIYYMKGTPGFEKTLSSVIGVLYNNAVMVQEMPEPSSVTEPVRFGSYGYSGWKISLTPKKVAEMAVSYGHDESLYSLSYIDNPVKKEILDNINRTAIGMFVQGNDAEKRYVLQFAKNVKDNIDLTEICSWLDAQGENKIDGKLRDALILCATERAKHGDKQLAWVEIKRYAAEYKGKELIEKGWLAELYIAWAGEELSLEEAEILANAYGKTPEQLKRLNEFIARMRDILYYSYKAEDFSDCLELSEVSGLIPFVQKLQEVSSYKFNPREREELKSLMPYGDKCISFIKLTGLGFRIDQVPITILMVENIKELENIKQQYGDEFLRNVVDVCYTQSTGNFLRENEKRFGEVVKALVDIYNKFSPEYDLKSLNAIIGSSIAKFLEVTPELWQIYMEIFLKIYNSPSQEIQRIKDQLISQLLENPNPVQAYEKIEQIFIKNNLPTVGKVFKIFSTLYPTKHLELRLAQYNTSPVLKAMSTRRKYYTLYRDLLRCHIESGNRSLRDYAAVLFEGQQYLDKAETLGWEQLTSEEKERLGYILKKFHTLLQNSTLGSKITVGSAGLAENLNGLYEKLRKALGVKAGQKISDRVAEMYLKPAGIGSLRELLQEMSQKKAAAHDRNVDLVKNAIDGKLTAGVGDMFKGVDMQYISNIFQNGSVAKEFLGAGADQDSTPMDTDVAVIQPEDMDGGFAGALSKTMATDYAKGGLLFCVKDRGQFQKTVPGQPATYEKNKLELFITGTRQHYGIRTGFPLTEVDFMIAMPELAEDRQKLENLYFEISQNDYYIPVVDQAGLILFTPELYRQYRNIFAGLDRFGNRHLKVELIRPEDSFYPDIQEIKKHISVDQEKALTVSRAIRQHISEALQEVGVRLKPEYDSSILGAELVDIGSTGRGTNLPNSFDFDYNLKLDAEDIKKIDTVADSLKRQFVYSTELGSYKKLNYIQLRFQGVTKIGNVVLPEPMDIDIGVGSKAELKQFETQDALKEKLEYIKSHNGILAYQDALANIIMAKRILKEAHAYKKEGSEGGEGGFGGVGTENWILANNGNILRAFRTFRNAAYDSTGQRLSLSDFKKRYLLYDAGINIRKQRHDNFIELLTQEGYGNMLDAIEKYLH